MRSRVQLVVRSLIAADAIVLSAVLALVWQPTDHTRFRELFLLLLVVPLSIFLLRYFGVYESHRLEGFAGLARKLFSAQFVGFLVLLVAMLPMAAARQWRNLLLFYAIGTAALLVQRAAAYLPLQLVRRRGMDTRRALVVGNWNAAEELATRFRHHPEWALEITCVGLGDPDSRAFMSFPDRKPLPSALEDVLRTEVVDEIVIAVAPEHLPAEKGTLTVCEQYGVVGRVMLHDSSTSNGQARLEGFCGGMAIAVGGVPGDTTHAVVLKRIMDVLLSIPLIAIFAPVMVIAALLVKLSSPGPIIFKQKRAGLHGRPFVLYKFRTMVDGAEGMLHVVAQRSVAGGPIFKDPVDHRITPVGAVLRRFSIDELPQLFNVLKGNMSLVGPRPLPLHEAQAITGTHRRRFSMRPGITCLWQVNGRSNVEYTRWMAYDLQYVDGWSLWLDTKLLLRTIPAVFSGRGAY